MPLMTINTLHYQCYCQSDEEGIKINNVYQWSQWVELSHNFKDFRYTRRLMIDNGNDYVAEEYSRHITYFIVANFSLPDSVYSASSEHDANHGAIRARIDNYFDVPCCWSARGSEQDPWLMISLPKEYVIKGAYIKRRCDYHNQYPTMVDVMTSSNKLTWESVVSGDNIELSSDDTAFVNIWFSKKYISKYWRVIISAFVSHPSMKCDLLGYGVE